MTDHNREELRRALIRAEHEWPGNLERRIDAILSVFEQANTPTSDEREVLIDAIRRSVAGTHGIQAYLAGVFADAILAAGFRRTVQGEPTQEERDAGLSEAHSESYRLGWRAGRASVQGEPTDAQLSEIERRVYDEHRGEVAGFAKALIRAGWAAALRAAAAVSRGRAEPVSWVIWPREGTSVNVIIRSGKVMLSSADANWYMRKEGQGHG